MDKKTTKTKVKQDEKIEVCKVEYYKGSFVVFNFKGCGVKSINPLKTKNKTITVKYISDIGKADFQFKIIK